MERFWAKQCDFTEVEACAKTLRKRHWEYQRDAGIDGIGSNDFSLYDNMLDTAVMLGAIPKRFAHLEGEARYFAMARGNQECVAMEMTKWFNTNYHYIVPELSPDDNYCLDASKVLREYHEAKALGIATKINLIGPITFLGLSKRIDQGDTYEMLSSIVPLYKELFSQIAALDDTVTVQCDEPIFVMEHDAKVLSLIKPTYDALCAVSDNISLIVTSYFEHSNEATKVLVNTPVYGIGLDFLYGAENAASLELIAQSGKKLIAGVVDGRNIWKNNMSKSRELLESMTQYVDRANIVVSSSCSLLHTPFTLKYEEKMDNEIRNWLSYAVEKLDEIALLATLFADGETGLSVTQQQAFQANIAANRSRNSSPRIHDIAVQKRVATITKWEREGSFDERIAVQKERLAYRELATTTIGSFPQTPQVREARREFKNGALSREAY